MPGRAHGTKSKLPRIARCRASKRRLPVVTDDTKWEGDYKGSVTSSESVPEGKEQPRWHTLDVKEAARTLESDATAGLSASEAQQRLSRFGRNVLPEARRRSLVIVFLTQFTSPLIYLLLIAGGTALALGHRSDAMVIVSVVVLNGVIGALQEGRAERALAGLRKLAPQNARVVRGDQEQATAASEVVPGDVLLIEAGDAICADGRILDGAAFQVAEAALTGESVPVRKQLSALAPATGLSDRTNMVYAGTHVTAGRARVLVTATGLATEIGHIATLAATTREQQTPLERRVNQFGRYVMATAIVASLFVVAIGLHHGIPLDQILMVAISQLVGMIPEGLPVAMTIALAVGVQRMARRKAVVRRLAAVETLGSTTVICSDKTGTLTRNEMTATTVFLPNGHEVLVSGIGYDPVGKLRDQGSTSDADHASKDLRALLEAAVLCNDAQLVEPDAATGAWKSLGDPTEVALLTLAIKGGIMPRELRERCPRRAEIPFDPISKMMATQHEMDGRTTIFVKGAPEEVLQLCTNERTEQDAARGESIAKALEVAHHMAEQALRVLAFAQVEGAGLDPSGGLAALRGSATFLGLIGQIDPPRPEVKEAIARCHTAGIRTVMVTGDHKATGRAVATALGIMREGDAVVNGPELEQMSNDELVDRIDKISVFARVLPAQKLRIIDAHQKRHNVVAMTGDGVNDVPALVKANVGVAMGMTGTEAAKESAEIVISDDNFATIVAAVEEGRVVYRNIKKAVLLLFSTSVAEVLVLMLALLFGYPAPLAAVQILWNNLVTEGLITVNLVMEPAEGDEMNREPIPRHEPLLTRVLLFRTVLMTLAIVISTLGWFIVRTNAGIPEAQVRTETFTLLAICEWFNVLNCRSETKSGLSRSLFSNRWLLGGLILGNLLQAAVVFWEPLGRIFYTVPISLEVAFALAVVGSLVLWAEELRKWIVRRGYQRSAIGVA